jgi:hypothetical protein
MGKGNINPVSLSNLKPGESPGRAPMHESPKQRHGVTVTNEGWEGIQSVADGFGYSISELLDQIGRGNLAVLEVEAINTLQDALDVAEARTALLEAQQKGTKPLQQVLSEMGLGAE